MPNPHLPHPRLTIKILLGMLAGFGVGVFIHLMPTIGFVDTYITRGILEMGGTIFITLLRMLVVPIVFVSLVCGTCHLGDVKKPLGDWRPKHSHFIYSPPALRSP